MPKEGVEVVNLGEKFGLFSEPWKPKIIAELNDSYVKAVKLKGEFVWHHHDNEDELFFVRKGRLVIKLKNRDLHLKEGELVVIPKGTEHKPVAKNEVEILLLEPKTTLNTGNVSNERTATRNGSNLLTRPHPSMCTYYLMPPKEEHDPKSRRGRTRSNGCFLPSSSVSWSR